MQLVLVPPEVLAGRPWHRIGGTRGALEQTLWSDGDGSFASLLRLEPGTGVPGHRHHDAVHHIWIVQGACRLGSRSLTPDSYCFVPAGVHHEIPPVGPRGCTMFYVHLRTGDGSAERTRTQGHPK